MASVVVTDGQERAALAVVRSLGRAGHDCTVCAPTAASLASASRHSRRSFAVGDPLGDPAGFAERVIAVTQDVQADVVLPISEAALAALLPQRARVRGVLPFASGQAFSAICDKDRVLREAARLGVRTPRQHVLRSPPCAADLGAVQYPVVVKATRSVVDAGARRIKTGVAHAADRGGLIRALERLPEAAYPLLVQERVVGPGIGIFLLLHGGDTVAAFAHRRIREKPPSGGVSVYRESRALDADLLEKSVTLLRAFDWEGVAMVEYKLDERDGTPYLMEINGRFWGSLQLAVDAGVDFPALLVEQALGRGPAVPPVYREGVRSRWLMGDVDHLLARLRRSATELGLPPGSSGRVRACVDFVTAFDPRSQSEVFRLGDPLPSLVELKEWVRGR
ncbi:hypothetical protein BH23GEM9_BH23GEM9_23160 [soil metagenome]